METKNESYAQAVPKVSMKEERVFLSRIGKRDFFSYEKIEFIGESYYYDRFYRGAEILPQSFWFVEISETPLGYDAQKPYVRTPKAILYTAKKLGMMSLLKETLRVSSYMMWLLTHIGLKYKPPLPYKYNK